MPTNEKTINESVLDTNEFELPIGIEVNGVFQKTIKLKEMTGAVEEAIADSKVRNNGGKIVTEAVFGITDKLGNSEKVRKEHIRNMYNADRDFVLLMNHKVSVGDTIEWTEVCPRCEEKFDVKVDVDDIPVTYMKADEPKEISIELPNGIKDAEGKVYKKMKISLPTGFVQERVFPVLSQNPSQAITQMLALITEDIEGLDHWNPDTFKNMTKKDRNHISKELAKVNVGVDIAPEVNCANCGHEYKAVIPIQTLLGE